MNNFKGKLQEFCQKKSMSLPIYSTKRLITINSLDHMPDFVSVVEVDEKKFKGSIAPSKKAAETSAAQVALENILSRLHISKLKYSGPRVCILIDIENQASMPDLLLDHLNIDSSNVELLIFASEASPLAQKQWNHPKIFPKTVPIVRSDAADTFMIFETGKLAFQKTYEHYLIISGDHFAKTLEEILVLNGSNAKNVTNVDNIISFLEELNEN